MIYLSNLQKASDTDNIVNMIHAMPFDPLVGLGKTEEQLLENGFLVEELPANLVSVGQVAILHINPITLEMYYEYQDEPETALKKELSDISVSTAEYMVDLDFRLSNIELGL